MLDAPKWLQFAQLLYRTIGQISPAANKSTVHMPRPTGKFAMLESELTMPPGMQLQDRIHMETWG